MLRGILDFLLGFFKSDSPSDWQKLTTGYCPNCSARKITVYAQGGVCLNGKCSNCGARYWWSTVDEEYIERLD